MFPAKQCSGEQPATGSSAPGSTASLLHCRLGWLPTIVSAFQCVEGKQLPEEAVTLKLELAFPLAYDCPEHNHVGTPQLGKVMSCWVALDPAKPRGSTHQKKESRSGDSDKATSKLKSGFCLHVQDSSSLWKISVHVSSTHLVLRELPGAKYWVSKGQQAMVLALEQPTVLERRQAHKWAL